MKKLIKIFNALLFLILTPILFSSKAIYPPCKSIKNGTFHFYQNNGQYHSVIIRKDSLQTEVNLSTGDSTFWKIVWISDCKFTSSYISGSKIKTPEELDFYKKSTLTFNIIKISEKYYTWDALFSSNGKSRTFSDTMWLKER